MAGVQFGRRGTGMHLSWSLLFALAAASVIVVIEAQPIQETSPSVRMRYFLNLKRQGKQVEHLIKELNNLTDELKAKENDIKSQLPPEFIDPMAPLEKRARSPECYMAAGLSRSCDYKDLIAAVEERDFWNSVNSPGKRRRRGVDTPSKTSLITNRLDEVRNTDAKISKMENSLRQ